MRFLLRPPLLLPSLPTYLKARVYLDPSFSNSAMTQSEMPWGEREGGRKGGSEGRRVGGWEGGRER